MMLAVYIYGYTFIYNCYPNTQYKLMCMYTACTIIPSWGPNRPVLELGHAGHAPSRSIHTHTQAWWSTRVIPRRETLLWPLTFDLPGWGDKLAVAQPIHPIMPPNGGDYKEGSSRPVVLSYLQWRHALEHCTCTVSCFHEVPMHGISNACH